MPQLPDNTAYIAKLNDPLYQKLLIQQKFHMKTISSQYYFAYVLLLIIIPRIARCLATPNSYVVKIGFESAKHYFSKNTM